MNELQVFNFKHNDVRVIEKNGAPWFIAKDVCDVLGINNSRQALRLLDKDDLMSFQMTSGGQKREMNGVSEAIKPLDDDEISELSFSEDRKNKVIPRCLKIISESGLYTLIMRSNKPDAKKFRKWITSEVIPSIHKHGAYMTPETIEKTLTNPDFIIQLAQQLKSEQAKSRELQCKIDIDKPKVLFADAVDIY